MSILITTPTQLDTLLNNCQTFILQKVITNIPDYNSETANELVLTGYELANKAFRSQAIEGLLMFFKKRHGVSLPVFFDFYIVNSGKTAQQAFQDWSYTQEQILDQDPIKFTMYNLAYYANFNNNLFYQFVNPSLTLQNIVVD